MAIGASPTSVAIVVIRMGRSRMHAALRMAFRVERPNSLCRLANSTINTEFDTLMPTIINTPMHDWMLSEVLVSQRVKATLIRPKGAETIMIKGSTQDPN